PDDLKELAALRIAGLPRATRDALLTASALAQPTIELVDGAALEPAEEAGLVRLEKSGRISFVHPLYSSSVYASASASRRRRLHQQLAELVPDLEERARHLALGSVGSDDRVAAVLDRAAERAR